MSLRSDITSVLQQAGHKVLPWMHTAAGRFAIVRPGGVSGERSVIEVWLVNPRASSINDPDEGLQEWADEVYALLRRHLVEPDITPGPEYNPSGKAPHTTMILNGGSPERLGVGG